jgi:hypothetical protein
VTEPKTKGAAIREMLLWHSNRYGHAATVALCDRVPQDLLGMLDLTKPGLGVLGASWYPISLTYPMLDRVLEQYGGEGRELAAAVNRDLVPKMIRGIYRMVFQTVASPELYARHVPRLWRRLHTTGDRRMRIVEEGEALSVVENWPGHHPFMCWTAIYTMAYVFEAMGYKHWSVERTACVSHGAQRCETTLRYRK